MCQVMSKTYNNNIDDRAVRLPFMRSDTPELRHVGAPEPSNAEACATPSHVRAPEPSNDKIYATPSCPMLCKIINGSSHLYFKCLSKSLHSSPNSSLHSQRYQIFTNTDIHKPKSHALVDNIPSLQPLP